MIRIQIVAALVVAAMATPAFAMSEADCASAWTKVDTKSAGFVGESEAGRYFAAHRIANMPIADGKLTKDVFLTNCRTDLYVAAKAEAGAPLSGANSFTEAQAKDRVTLAGYANVSALVKDANGVWRGTAMMDKKQSTVAVDFKGNVVVN